MDERETTLQDAIDASRAAEFSEGGLTTCIFVGQVSHEREAERALQLHRRAVTDEMNAEGTNITGLLIAQSDAILHLLEGSSAAILRILQKVANENDFSSGVHSGRICYCVEDRPARYYTEYFSTTLPERKSSAEALTGDTGKDAAHEMASTLLEFGKHIQQKLQEEDEIELGKFGELLPTKQNILGLAACDAFFSLTEYVDFYAGPYSVLLESESAWPLMPVCQY
jgi:hypothetical protein